MAHNDSLTNDQFHQHIDEQLDHRRRLVQRYEPGAEWLNDVVDTIDSSHISDKELRRLYVSSIVRKREGEATRSVTNMARKMAETGQMPLDWFQYADRPIAYTIEEQDEEGNPKKKETRVTLRAAKGSDFRAWARWREKQAKNTYDVEMKTVKVFRSWAREMEVGGFQSFRDYAASVTGVSQEQPD